MTLRQRLRRYFFTGLVVITPIGATWFILSWLFRRLDAILGDPLQAALGLRLPGVGLLLLLLLILLVGWLAYQTAGRQLIRTWDGLLVRFPLTATIYSTVSQFVQTFLGAREHPARRVVLVPYPEEGSWVVGFVTSEETPLVSATVGTPCVHVFVPLAPPTAGLLLVVPRSRVREVKLSTEEAMKLIVSGGAIAAPGSPSAHVGAGLDMERLVKRGEP